MTLIEALQARAAWWISGEDETVADWHIWNSMGHEIIWANDEYGLRIDAKGRRIDFSYSWDVRANFDLLIAEAIK